MGVKITLAFGGIGYCIYAVSLLVSLHAGSNVNGFCYFAGALLGVCAGLLWTAQGTIMMSYPLESEKGRSFAWFWTIFNLGGVVGSLIPLGQTVNHPDELSVGNGTYIAFIVLMFGGAVLALFLSDADKVIRSDGSRVVLMKNPSWSSEIIGLGKTIVSDPYILLLFPMFWSSNWFTTYQTNSVNGGYFNIRTRSLNSLLYWFSQMIGAIVFGNALDIERFKRTTRAKASLIVLFVLTFAIWGGGYKWQTSFTRDNKTKIKGDWKDEGYLGPMFLYMFYGFYDAAWQCCVYWYASPNSSVSPQSIYCIAAQANTTKVHGRSHQQRPQNGQLRRLLQGHSIRWRRCDVVPGLERDVLHGRADLQLGSSLRLAPRRRARHLLPYQGARVCRGGSQVQ